MNLSLETEDGLHFSSSLVRCFSPQSRVFSACKLTSICLNIRYAKNDPELIGSITSWLKEAAVRYPKDEETIDWFVMQDHLDPRSFTIVARCERESVSSSSHHILLAKLFSVLVSRLSQAVWGTETDLLTTEYTISFSEPVSKVF